MNEVLFCELFKLCPPAFRPARASLCVACSCVIVGQVRGQYKSEKVIEAGFLTGSGDVFYRVHIAKEKILYYNSC